MSDDTPVNDLVSLTEAAELLDVSYGTVYGLTRKSRKFPCLKKWNHRVITRETLQKLREHLLITTRIHTKNPIIEASDDEKMNVRITNVLSKLTQLDNNLKELAHHLNERFDKLEKLWE